MRRKSGYKLQFNVTGRKGKFEAGKVFKTKTSANAAARKYRKNINELKKHNAFERKFNGPKHKGISLKGTWRNLRIVKK